MSRRFVGAGGAHVQRKKPVDPCEQMLVRPPAVRTPQRLDWSSGHRQHIGDGGEHIDQFGNARVDASVTLPRVPNEQQEGQYVGGVGGIEVPP